MQGYAEIRAGLRQYFPLIHREGVRDVYRLPGKKLLVVVTDRQYIHGFGPFEVDGYGALINAFNVLAWTVVGARFQEDILFKGREIDEMLPEEFRNNRILQMRGTIVEELEMIPIRSVVRHLIFGDEYSAYRCGQLIGGNELPRKMREGTIIPDGPIWMTNDRTVDFRQAIIQYLEVPDASIKLFNAFQVFANKKGVMVADAQFNCGYTNESIDPVGQDTYHPHRVLVHAGGIFTPDSTSYISCNDYLDMLITRNSQGSISKGQAILEKWGAEWGLNDREYLNPENEEDRAIVRAKMPLSQDAIGEVNDSARKFFSMLSGMTVLAFQRDVLGIE